MSFSKILPVMKTDKLPKTGLKKAYTFSNSTKVKITQILKQQNSLSFGMSSFSIPKMKRIILPHNREKLGGLGAQPKH